MDSPKPLENMKQVQKLHLPIFENFMKEAVKKSDARPFKVPMV